jgi:hypothetical protein
MKLKVRRDMAESLLIGLEEVKAPMRTIQEHYYRNGLFQVDLGGPGLRWPVS